MVTITAAVSRAAGGEFSIEEVTLDEPRADEILVRIAGVGICHSDLLARDGVIPVALPSVFGHEGAGEVVAIGSSVDTIKIGDHVVISFGSCGVCGRCDHGEMAYCDQFAPLNYSGGRPDGSSAISKGDERLSSFFFGQSSFGTYALTRARNAVVLPPDVPVALMGPLGCGIQTGAGAIMNSLACRAGSSVLILGGGSVGLSAVLAAVVQGCSTIIVVEPHQARRDLALELGATHAIDPFAGETAGAVRAIIPAGVDYAFDATGIPVVIAAGVACLGMRGVLAIAGVPVDPRSTIALPILPLIGLGQTIKGVVEGDADPHVFLPHLVSLYREGRFPIDRLVTTYPFDRINDAVSDHQHGRCVKAVLIPA